MPKGKRWTDAEKARIIGMLRASAAKSPTGEPNLSAVERQSGATRKALRTWWDEVTGGATAAPTKPSASPPAAVVGDGHRAWAGRMLGIADLSDRHVEYVAGLAAERDAMTSDTGRAAATKTLDHAIQRLSRSVQNDDGPRSPEEWTALVVQMPEVLLAAWLDSPDLWDDERWTAAQAARAPDGAREGR